MWGGGGGGVGGGGFFFFLGGETKTREEFFMKIEKSRSNGWVPFSKIKLNSFISLSHPVCFCFFLQLSPEIHFMMMRIVVAMRLHRELLKK